MVSDHESCVLEPRPNDVAVALAKDPKSDPAMRGAVVKVLAMLYAMTSCKDQDLMHAAILCSAQTLPTESLLLASIAALSSATAAQSAPANVIADIVKPTTWNVIAQMVDVSCSLGADHTACKQLYLHVHGAVVSKNFL
ncbi:hypothetical protein GGF37_002449 [Kickxella alabastrina]|nr:hypothetical protein GGF37_002449 [Kickxella alabastrina]